MIKPMKLLFKSLFSRYQIGLETSRKDTGFISGCLNLLSSKYSKINLNRVRSYLDSPDWIGSKKATIIPINKNDNKCFL